MKPWRWLVALLTLLWGRSLGRRKRQDEKGRIVPAGTPQRKAENVVLILLAIAAAWAIGFVLVYAEYSPRDLPNEFLGVCLAMSLAFVAAAFAVVAKRLVVEEELEDEYPEENPVEQSELAQIVHESGSRITRKRLLLGAGAATAATVGVAALTPALSLGPLWYTAPLDRSPWRRGRRLVDEENNPLLADEIEQETFYTAFPEHGDKEDIAAPVVVVRLDPAAVHLPPGRSGWAPRGILAYSKICTHAGCAIALYGKPTFAPVEPSPQLVCPCHYSTFDPATGAAVTYGPAGRPLPQLPLMVDGAGYLRAAGDYSGRVGPAWWNVREQPS